tara:strand:+ start:18082 stop:18405 length:324 start_codon:yes stop_codon:yes gene_type:complete
MKFVHGEKRYTPTVLHTSIDGTGYLCGAERIGSWHDRCMTNQFVKSLPKCEDCEAVKGDRTKMAVTFPPPTVKENILSSPSVIDFDAWSADRSSDAGIYVKDYRRNA